MNKRSAFLMLAVILAMVPLAIAQSTEGTSDNSVNVQNMENASLDEPSADEQNTPDKTDMTEDATVQPQENATGGSDAVPAQY
jgi:hypothetical protein